MIDGRESQGMAGGTFHVTPACDPSGPVRREGRELAASVGLPVNDATMNPCSKPAAPGAALTPSLFRGAREGTGERGERGAAGCTGPAAGASGLLADFGGWSADEVAAWLERKRRLDAAEAARAAGGSQAEAARAAGVSGPTLWRDRRDWELAQAAGDARLFLPGRSTGRPAVHDWPAEDVQTIRKIYLRTNRTEADGSMSMSVRLAAHQGKLTDGSARVLKRKMATKHYIPSSLRRELQIAPAVRRHHRNPTNATLAGPYVPGTTRLTEDQSRRLYYGERISFDDGSQNQIVCVPWPWGGTAEADRYGIRTCRGQWLVGHCDGSSFVDAYSFTLRPRDSYRDPDSMGHVYRFMRDVVKPAEVVCEGGVWQSKRALAFYRAAGVRVINAKGRPHLKLIENWWNRAWTFLSHFPDGQIGRFRSEMERENDLLMRCRSGAVDGRKHFVMLPDLLREFDECLKFLNQDPVESDLYGKWVPSERKALDREQHARPRLDVDLSQFSAPEYHVVQVRCGGQVLCKTTCPLGIPHVYEFAAEALMPLEGQKVRVLYDPFEPEIRAAIVADVSAGEYKAGDLICQPYCLNPPPAPVALEGWQILRNPQALVDAAATKKALAKAVRTEYRAIVGDGKRELTEVRGPDGSVIRADGGAGVADGATVESTGTADDALTTIAGPRRKPKREEVDLEELSRFEETARVAVF